MSAQEVRTIWPGPVAGVLAAPPAKSVLQRALAAACLATGTSQIRSPPLSVPTPRPRSV